MRGENPEEDLPAMVRIALLSTSDTDLLSARASGADYVLANPARCDVADLAGLAGSADLTIVRLLGSPQEYDAELAAVKRAGRPVVVLGGEQAPDAALMTVSTVPVGIAADAHRYLVEGGPGNLAQLHAFLSDTVLLTGEGFEPPQVVPVWGCWIGLRSSPSRRLDGSASSISEAERGSESSTTARTR